MSEQPWHWARLDPGRLALLREAERTLGSDVVLVYGDGGPEVDPATTQGLRPAALDDSQLECLRGLESQLGAVAVAYRLPA
jgi:hypothetical protein